MRTYLEKAIERFWSHITVGKPDECWEWKCVDTRPTFWFGDRYMGAARFAWYIHTGIWPGALHVCHSCDNDLCMNPRHLWLGTTTDNTMDKVAKGRQARGSKTIDRGHTKLTEDDVCEIREKHTAGTSNVQLAKEYSLNPSHISDIINRKCWKHVK